VLGLNKEIKKEGGAKLRNYKQKYESKKHIETEISHVVWENVYF